MESFWMPVLVIIWISIWLLSIWWAIKSKNKLLAIAMVLVFGPIWVLAYELFWSTSHSRKKKVWAAIGVALTSLLIWIICYHSITGYYPIPELFRRIHYVNKLCENEDATVKVFLIDDNFLFSKKGYVSVAKLEGAEPLIYCLGTRFEGTLPMDYAFKGQILVEIEKDDHLIYSSLIKTTEKKSYVFGEDRRAYGIDGFDICTMPFYIAHKKYQNSEIRVTVMLEDLEMYQHIDSAKISLYPILQL